MPLKSRVRSITLAACARCAAALGCLVLAVALRPTLAAAQPGEPETASAGLFGSAADRRDAGRTRALTSWLQVSTLLEAEFFHYREDIDGGRTRSHEQGLDVVVQADWEAELQPWAKLELDHEYDFAAGRHALEELLLVLEHDDVELAMGKMYFPFGEYFSRFVTGPVLEFAETRDTGLLLAWQAAEGSELSLFAFDGRAQRAGGGRQTDWGAAINWQADPWRLGVAYLSDLAEADAELLQDERFRYQRRVPAAALHVSWSSQDTVVTAEYIGALASFAELDLDRDRPRAWNVEVSRRWRPDWHWALRVEGSRELEDEPRLRWGAAVNWRVSRSVTASVEVLQSRYRRGLAEDARGEELRSQRRLGLRLSVLF